VEREQTMAEITLVAELGRTTGSSESRRMRHSGRVPAVIYGHGMDPLSVSVGARDLRTALSTHGVNQVLTLKLDSATHLVLARQLQRHPVRRTVAHVDFQVVRADEIVSAEVPLVIVGTTVLVDREGGVLEHTLTSLTVHSTPQQIPEEISVDVSELEVGGSIRVRDLKLPEGVTTDVDPDEAVVVAAAARAEVAVEAAEAGAEPEVGAAGAAEEEG
jgi:large subunit ribosomal protein L25